MENGKDFIYEYSDLNPLRTRVQVLTGEYADTILEFGNSAIIHKEDKNEFTFEYELYQIPRHLKNIKLKQNEDFQFFLGNLLIDIISAKRQDKDDQAKVMQAISKEGSPICKIKIDPWFYENKLKVAA